MAVEIIVGSNRQGSRPRDRVRLRPRARSITDRILKSKRQRGDWNSSTSSIDDDLEQIIFEFILDKF